MPHGQNVTERECMQRSFIDGLIISWPDNHIEYFKEKFLENQGVEGVQNLWKNNFNMNLLNSSQKLRIV